MWVYDRQDEVYTALSYKVKSRLTSSYPNIRFVNSKRSFEEAVFPTVYISFLQTAEIGKDLEHNTLNGFVCTLDFAVSTSADQGMNALKEVTGVVIEELKSLHFDVSSIPKIDENIDDTWRMYGRASRTFGQANTVL